MKDVRVNQGTTGATEAGKAEATCEDFIAIWVRVGYWPYARGEGVFL